jgi:hypothetical protein
VTLRDGWDVVRRSVSFDTNVAGWAGLVVLTTDVRNGVAS